MTQRIPRDARLFLLLGLVAGVLSGLFGVGGGFLVVPLLIKLGFDTKRAAATSLAAVIPIAMAALIPYALDRKVHVATAAVLIIGAFVGARLGTALLPKIPARQLQFGFATLLVLAGVKLGWSVADGTMGDLTWKVDVGLALLGFATGVLSGLLGVGGGFIMVPGMMLIASMPSALARGTSLAVIIPTAIYGSIRNQVAALIEVGAAWRVGLGGAVASAVTARFAVGLNARISNAGFAVLLLVLAFYMWRTARRKDSESAP
jgi:uncharacterized protein